MFYNKLILCNLNLRHMQLKKKKSKGRFYGWNEIFLFQRSKHMHHSRGFWWDGLPWCPSSTKILPCCQFSGQNSAMLVIFPIKILPCLRIFWLNLWLSFWPDIFTSWLCFSFKNSFFFSFVNYFLLFILSFLSC